VATRPFPKRSHKSRPKPDRIRALEFLAMAQNGASEALLLAHDVTVEQMVTVVRLRHQVLRDLFQFAASPTVRQDSVRLSQPK
jgi:hypothetical protein